MGEESGLKACPLCAELDGVRVSRMPRGRKAGKPHMEGDPAEYLGDGAYVRFTGFSFVVYTTDGLSVQNEVHLEASALKVLDRFVKRMKQEHGGA